MKQYLYFIKSILLLSLLLTYGTNKALAQSLKNENADNKISFGFDQKKGLGIKTTDDFFSLNFRFRMQNSISIQKADKTEYDAEIRDFRLRLDGHLYSPKLSYKIQVSLAPKELKHKEEESLNIIKDLLVQYQFDKNWSLLFGHTKLPGNRQQLSSSGELQLTDRSINNSKFRLESDLGLHLQYKAMYKEAFSYAITTAISTGKALLNKAHAEDNYALTGKLELYPFGEFTDGGAKYEGDLARETSPKLLVSGAFHHTNNALHSQGIKGAKLYEATDIQAVFVDLLFKYKGWAAMFAYLNRSADNIATQSNLDPSLKAFVFAGQGTDYQLSYLFPSKYEITARFSNQSVDDQLKQNHFPDTKQWSLGATKYIWNHKIKLQTQVSYQQESYQLKSNKDSWYARIQIEVGI